MFISLSQQNPHTQQPSQPLPDSRRLNKLIIPLNQHLTQRLGTGHEHTTLIEKPAIVQHAIIRHIVDPITLRLSRRVTEDARKVAQDGVGVLLFVSSMLGARFGLLAAV